jgi:hypothetical protein
MVTSDSCDHRLYLAKTLYYSTVQSVSSATTQCTPLDYALLRYVHFLLEEHEGAGCFDFDSLALKLIPFNGMCTVA